MYRHKVEDSCHCFFYVLATCPYFLMGLVGEGLVKNFELIRALKDGDVLAEWNLDLLNST